MTQTPHFIDEKVFHDIDQNGCDPDWPILNSAHCQEVLQAWDKHNGVKQTLDTYIYQLTHSHAGEFADLAEFGNQEGYIRSKSTKFVSLSWHLAGRFRYDELLIKTLEDRDWPPYRLVDFGAACWIQAIFYARKGLQVTVMNLGLESDTNRFGRWLAYDYCGLPQGTIKEYASPDPAWHEEAFDVVYAVDVLEHIPPADELGIPWMAEYPPDTPGWIPYVEKLKACLLRGEGMLWNTNAPLDLKPGRPEPQPHHPSHYTSPLLLQHWEKDNGFEEMGTFLRRYVG